MSHELVTRAQRLTDLPAKTQLVYVAMCDKTDHRQGGFFFKDLAQFLADDVPFVSSLSALRNHLQILRARGYIKTAKRGTGGLGGASVWKRSKYYIDAPGITPPLPDDPEQLQLRLFTLLKPYDTTANMYSADTDRQSASGSRKSVSALTDIDKESVSGQRESVSALPDIDKQSASVPGESVSALTDIGKESVSALPDSDNGYPYKRTEEAEKEEAVLAHAAAAESVSANQQSLSDFWYDVSTACSQIGINGVMPHDFAELEPLISQCPRTLTVRDAQWIADEVKIKNTKEPVRSVKFVVYVARQFISGALVPFFIDSRNRETHGTHDSDMSESAQPESYSVSSTEDLPEEVSVSCDHIPAAAAADIWAAVLTKLESTVPRPAFATWLTDTVGVMHRNDEFVVGTANAFIAEMLEHRLYPQIERAIEDVVGKPTKTTFCHGSCTLTEEAAS